VRKAGDARDWEGWIDQQIRDAQERGAFDNLPGRGQPIDLTPNPYARDEELAFKILKDAGYAPEWIELDKTIRSKIERARATLTRRWAWYNERLVELMARPDRRAEIERERVETGWRRAVADFEMELDAINREIVELNLKVPSPRFQRCKVEVKREVEQVTGKVRCAGKDVQK
jgi:DnaJ family protein C protein 28